MNFHAFWKQLSKNTSSKKEFFTLSRKNPFTATYHNGSIIIKPSRTKHERPLSRNEFFKVWRKASKLSASQRYVPNNYYDDTFHSSYIVALMKSIIKDNEITI